MTATRLAVYSLAAALFVAACTPVQAPAIAPAATDAPAEAAAAPMSPDQQAMADATVAWAAGELGVAAADITVQSVEAVEWPDSALGCPQPDMIYAAVITPGYQVMLEAQGTTYAVHTDSRPEGEKIICTE